MLDILVCPTCGRFRLELLSRDNEFFLYCDKCRLLYPFKDVVYITDRCDTRKCNKECITVCDQRAMYLTFRKKLKINENCNFCRQCVSKCPRNALIAIKTPFLLPKHMNRFAIEVSSMDNYEIVRNLSGSDKQLRTFDESHMLPSTALTNEYILSKIKKLNKRGIILDDGCGANGFKAFMKDHGFNVLGMDITVDRNAYYPLQFLMNGEYLPIKDNSISLCTSNFVLEHTTNPLRYLNEVHRVLKEDGTAIVSIPTPYFHLAYSLRYRSYRDYLLHIVKNPGKFLRNPIRDFLTEWAHEKEWNIENTKTEVTFIDEIRRWKLENWEEMLLKSSFSVIDRKITGNIFSLNRGKWIKKLGDPKKIGVHCTYILRKDGNT